MQKDYPDQPGPSSWEKGWKGIDSDVTPGFPSNAWINGSTCTDKTTHEQFQCGNPGAARKPAWVSYPPYVRTVERACPTDPTPTPTPAASPTPGPTPTPGPGGCPVVSQVGGSFLTARDCGPKCIEQGYLGYVVNVTSTALCQNGTPGCTCDPARNRCETPKECQDPRGSTVYLSLPGHFSHDLADERSDNPWNHQHKPKAAETGVTEFLHCPWHAPWDDGRCTPKCMDIQRNGPREVKCQ